MKPKTYRNRALLDLVRWAPICMGCDRPNDGTVVPAHGNRGKGMGLKASDATVMALCYRCHAELDQGKSMTREDRRAFADQASAKTLQWMIEAGHLVVKKGP